MKIKFSKANLLIEKLVDETISEQEHQQLQDYLANSEEVRREYIRQMQLHSSLQVYADVEDTRNNEHPFVFPAQKGQNYFGPVSLLFLACSLMVCLIVGFFNWPAPTVSKPAPLTVISIEGVDSSNDLSIGSKIDGPISISRGLLTLATDGGSLISLEGPCQFEMTQDHVGRLDYGNLVAFCGENAKKLTVDTPTMQYTDLGTEFGVKVTGGSSSLHVFDGLVMASDIAKGAGNPVLVEAASSLRTDSKDRHSREGLVDLVSFNQLRRSLAVGGISEEFDVDPELDERNCWELSSSKTDQLVGKVASQFPLAAGLGGYYQVKALGASVDPANSKMVDSDENQMYSSAMLSFDYGKLESIDLEKAHTVECVLRLECDPQDVEGLMMFGGDEVAWQKRAWELRALPNEGKLMWSNYNPTQSPMGTYQYLETERDRVYHLLVEIDPVIGRYRKTVSNGKNRVWSELSDGSAAKLKLSANSLGMLHWRIRGMPSKEVAFSVDAIRVRNRPDAAH